MPESRAVALLLVTTLGLATPAVPSQEKKQAARPQAGGNGERLSLTHHEVVVAGQTLRYRATAGYLPLRSEAGEVTARIFHVAYTQEEVPDVAKRPVTFVFNGGPGSSSIWLHLGTVGPRRVLMSEEGLPLPPPGRVVPCAETWLDLSDLVFIDPVGTGYSRPAKGHQQKEFSGLEEDTASVGEFIRRWTTENLRWRSPKFLAGESYGTTRAASLASHLQDRHRMYLNGIVLVSTVLNFQTIRFHPGNDLPHALFLPGYAATARYHGCLAADVQAADLRTFLAEVEAFALGDYLLALAKGDALGENESAEIAARVARYTGLAPSYVEAANLRLTVPRFTKELLRQKRTTIGRLDSRLEGADRDAAGERYEFDPSMAAIDGPFGQAFNDYVRRELRYGNDLPYEVLTPRVQPWSYKNDQNRYVNVAENLRQAMNKNRHLKVLVASGYYDLATPYFAADYTVAHLMLEPELRRNVRVRYYEAGHMMYIHAPSRVKLKRDVAEFYAWARPRE